jgi:hypothetical protein
LELPLQINLRVSDLVAFCSHLGWGSKYRASVDPAEVACKMVLLQTGAAKKFRLASRLGTQADKCLDVRLDKKPV